MMEPVTMEPVTVEEAEERELACLLDFLYWSLPLNLFSLLLLFFKRFGWQVDWLVD